MVTSKFIFKKNCSWTEIGCVTLNWKFRKFKYILLVVFCRYGRGNEGYGILMEDFKTVRHPWKMEQLREMMICNDCEWWCNIFFEKSIKLLGQFQQTLILLTYLSEICTENSMRIKSFEFLSFLNEWKKYSYTNQFFKL